MRIPRDIDHYKLIKLLNQCGYLITRQTGCHVRLTRNATEKLPKHHIAIPSHNPIRIGTLSRILNDVADHLGIDREELLQKL